MTIAVTAAVTTSGNPAASNVAPSVALRDVTIAFRLAGGATYAAVQNASLAVGAGEFVTIVGPTGCGKSTLLNVAAGLLVPSSGRVEVFGSPLAGLNCIAGYLFQSDALFPWKTALENVAIGSKSPARPRRLPASERNNGWRGWGLRNSGPAIRTCSQVGSESAWASPRC